ncbi:MAG TPA: hypothetical protein PKN95_13805 [Verrucomicrobiota bacterium]|nr:hypothetical protein [Verrucomicrobiota bacterium]HNT15299.1 hypothetical protein [Verrucomicrobiota bacterium]
MIPKTLAAVAQFAARDESFDLALRNFLDGFYARPTADAISDEPECLADKVPRLGAVKDAYLAATAEWLAWKYDLPLPAWTRAERRSLRRPWFASPLDSLRAVLLLESPAAFRSRNLFVSENALTRA